MSSPLISEKDGIKIKPELMETEKLYHCVFQDKVMLVYKDNMEVLHCYEIEEKELVEKVKSCSDPAYVEKIFEEYIKKENLKN